MKNLSPNQMVALERAHLAQWFNDMSSKFAQENEPGRAELAREFARFYGTWARAIFDRTLLVLPEDLRDLKKDEG